MSAEIKGSCLCGAVEYKVEGTAEYGFHCYCNQCQKGTGTGHSSQMAIKRDQLKTTGEPASYTRGSDAGYDTTHYFCKDCGSPLMSSTTRFDDTIYLHIGNLDNSEMFKAEFVAHKESLQPWDYFYEDMREV